MEREIVAPSEMRSPGSPLSPAVKVGNFIFTSGQLGVSPITGKLVEGGVEGEARQVLENIATILTEAGSSMDKVVKTTVFLTNIDDRTRIGHVYSEYFPRNPPARSAVAVRDLAGGALIEIDAVAVV